MEAECGGTEKVCGFRGMHASGGSKAPFNYSLRYQNKHRKEDSCAVWRLEQTEVWPKKKKKYFTNNSWTHTINRFPGCRLFLEGFFSTRSTNYDNYFRGFDPLL